MSKHIALYDFDDNYITEFNDYKECAKYFNTTADSIKSHMCRLKKNQLKKKRDKRNKRWCNLFIIKDEAE